MKTPEQIRQLKEALTKYQAMWQKQPDSTVFAHVAETQRQLGDLESAKKSCETGLQAQPQFHAGRVVLARVLMDLKQMPQAQKELTTVIKQVPNHLVAHQLLARSYFQADQIQHAAAIAKRLQHLAPEDETAKAILARTSQPAAAPARSQGPTTATMAKLYEEQGHIEKALELYQQLATQDPSHQGKVDDLRNRLLNQKKIAMFEHFLKVTKEEANQNKAQS